jgi:large subunit ribosomal protein L7/L12
MTEKKKTKTKKKKTAKKTATKKVTKEKKRISAKEIIEAVENMTVKELAKLVDTLEERFGVVATTPVTVTTPTAGEEVKKEEEKTEFDVVLTNIGEKKIQVIKEVRALTKLGLKEAKAVVDNAPEVVLKGIGKEEAENAKKKLEDVGATVEIK